MNVKNEEIKKTIEYAVSETFGGMAFAELDRIEVLTSLPTFSDMNYFASIELKSPLCGWIHMIVKDVYAFEYVSAMPSVHPNDVHSFAKDFVEEMINTTAGFFMRELHPGSFYELGLPICYMVSENRNPVSLSPSSLVLSFEFEDKKIYFAFTPAKN